MRLSELMSEAKKGSRIAQNCLWEELYDHAYHTSVRYVKIKEDASDIVQNSFIKFFDFLPRFIYQHDGGVHTLLKKIVIQQSIMFLRKNNSFSLTREEDAKEIAITDDAFGNLAISEIREMILQLPVGYRTVFTLYE